MKCMFFSSFSFLLRVLVMFSHRWLMCVEISFNLFNFYRFYGQPCIRYKNRLSFEMTYQVSVMLCEIKERVSENRRKTL